LINIWGNDDDDEMESKKKTKNNSNNNNVLPEINFIPQCYTNYEPRMKNSLSEIINNNKSNWTLNISFFDKSIIEKNIHRNLGYLDRKYIFISTGINSILTINIYNQQYARIWLCQCQKGFQRYPSYMIDLHEGADLFIQSVLPRSLVNEIQNNIINSSNNNNDNTTNTILSDQLSDKTKLGKLKFMITVVAIAVVEVLIK